MSSVGGPHKWFRGGHVGRHAGTGQDEPERTGYYVAGRDWPAIPNAFSIQDLYAALDHISDDSVEAAKISLRRSTSGF